MSLAVASLHVYPIKSLGGFMLNEAHLTDRGFEHDRRWMLVDEAGVFVTQRQAPEMACLHCSPLPTGFRVTDLRNGSAINLPWSLAEGERHKVSVWSDVLSALHGEAAWDAWFSASLERTVRLMYMPDASKRRTDGRYTKGLTSLSDGFPYLIVSQASLDDLNERLPEAIGMERFRANLVVAGGTAFQEDTWTDIQIGEARFQLVKPCARCVVITTDQRSGTRSKEPLRTLATYRSKRNKVMFGMNAVGLSGEEIRVGDRVNA